MASQFFICKDFLEVEGIWKEVERKIFVINVYVSHDLKNNEIMWEEV